MKAVFLWRWVIGKKKTVQETKNNYEYKTAPETKDITALRELKATVDPSISYNYAQRRNDLASSFKNPLGGYTTPAVRDAAIRAGNAALSQDESQAVQASQYNADNANYARQAGLAAATAPQLVQTGGTQTQTQSGGLLGNILGGVAQAGLGYATGGLSTLGSSALGSAKKKPHGGGGAPGGY